MKVNLDEGVITQGKNTEGRLITEAESWLKLGFKMKGMLYLCSDWTRHGMVENKAEILL